MSRQAPQSTPMSSAESIAPEAREALDRLGAGAAFLCAVHCAALPLLSGVLPLLGLSFLASDTFELIFVSLATMVGAGSVGLAYRRHGRCEGLVFLLVGIALLWAGRWVDVLHHEVLPHAVVMTVGGVAVSLGHLANLRRLPWHVHDERCSHGVMAAGGLGQAASGDTVRG